VVAVLVALGGAIYMILRPPAPLELPERDATLNNVTLIQPGHDRWEHRRVVVKGNTIEAIGDAYAGVYDAGAKAGRVLRA
jgi:hypothetical protein